MRLALLALPLFAVLALGLIGKHRHAAESLAQRESSKGPSVNEGELMVALASPQPVLAEFYADWCPACHSVAPTLDSFAQEVRGQAAVIRLNVDQNDSLGVKYHIREIPCFITFVGGREVARQTGELSLAGLHQLLSVSASKP